MDKDLLKKKLHEQIDALDDELLLHMLLYKAEEFNQPEEESELTPWQLERLNESIQQADEGKTIPHEKVVKQIKEYLQKKKLEIASHEKNKFE